MGMKYPSVSRVDGGLNAIRSTISGVAFVLVISGCAATLPAPAGDDLGLLILSIEAQRSIGSNKPDQLTISRVEDGADYSYSGSDGRYYYFANLPAGTYRIRSASFSIGGQKTTAQSGNLTASFSVNATNAFPFTEQHIESSRTRLEPGGVAFMAKITAEGTAKMFPPGAIEISNIRLDKSAQARDEAMDRFRTNFADSPWLSNIK